MMSCWKSKTWHGSARNGAAWPGEASCGMAWLGVARHGEVIDGATIQAYPRPAPDDPTNVQWQAVEDARVKDRWE